MRKRKNPRVYLLMSVVFILYCPCMVLATTYYVNPGESIQAAIDNASYGDTVKVAAGMYVENITLKNGVAVIGEVIGNEPNNTVIDGNEAGSVVTSNNCDPNTVLDGLTITNGHGFYGGGMYNTNNSRPMVINCTFSLNWSDNDGGGMSNSGSEPIVTNCAFSNNGAESNGGGMNNDSSSPAITNCTFISNDATFGDGGGMYNTFSSSPTVTNCTFRFNTDFLGNGNAIYNSLFSNPTVTNCILWGDNQIYGGTPSVTYSNVKGGYTGTGNIDVDPLFVSGSDTHLQNGSPCIDAGDNYSVPAGITTDPDGHPRIIDGDCNDTEIIDIGTYEFNYSYIGDLDYDCDADYGDFAILALAWLSQPGDGEWNRFCDISIPSDNYIDWGDLNVLTDNWLFSE